MKRELQLTTNKDAGPAYLAIAETIRSSIKKGRLKPGEALPSLREIARSSGAHRHTVMSALHELISEGWIQSAQRKGYSVSNQLPSQFLEVNAKSLTKTKQFSFQINKKVTTNWRNERNAEAVKYNFRSGMGDLRLFPIDELRQHLNDGLKRNPERLLAYGSPAGHPPLVAEVEQYLRRVRGITGRKVFITHGSQEGIFLLAQILLHPGDCVLVEDPGYRPAWDAFQSCNAKLVGVSIDEKGLIPEALEKAVKLHRPRMLYLTPLHQYPTTVTMPIDRRLKIYEIAAKNGCLILEDDYDHEYHYRSNPLPPLAAEDSYGIVLYVSTFSKILFPSARIGFMAVPENLYSPLYNCKATLSRQNETLFQEAVARWMREGGFERHLRKMRRTYHERRDVMLEALSGLSLRAPDGGMAIWIDCGKNSEPIVDAAYKKGVFCMPGSFYRMDKKESNFLRLGFATQSPTEIRAGVKILRACF